MRGPRPIPARLLLAAAELFARFVIALTDVLKYPQAFRRGLHPLGLFLRHAASLTGSSAQQPFKGKELIVLDRAPTVCQSFGSCTKENRVPMNDMSIAHVGWRFAPMTPTVMLIQ